MPCNFLTCTCCRYTAPMRHVIATLLLLAVVLTNIQRSVFNMALVEMVYTHKSVVMNTACKSRNTTKKSVIENIHGGKFLWDERIQSILLMMFYLAYIPVHFVAGYLSDKFGARWTLFAAIFISTLCTFLTPPAAIFVHWSAVLILRILIGATQGFLFPCVTSALSRWIPANERAVIGGAVYASNNIGFVIGNLGTGFMIHHFKSWVAPFIVWGIITLLYCIFFLMYTYSGPEEHPRLPQEELEFLLTAIKKKDKVRLPLLKILKDPCVWGMIFGQIGNAYVLFLMMNNLPKYMNNVLNFNIKKNAWASALPFMFVFILTVASGKLADYAIKKKNANITLVRKVYTAFALMAPATFCVLAVYMKCNGIAAMAMFTLGSFCKGPYWSGLRVNSMDISKNHAGFMMALSNGLGGLSGLIGPYVIGAIAYQNTLAQWEIVMWIAFLVSFAGTLLYCILGKTSRRDWDYLEGEVRPPKPTEKIPWYKQMTDAEFAEQKAKDDAAIKTEKEARAARINEENKAK